MTPKRNNSPLYFNTKQLYRVPLYKCLRTMGTKLLAKRAGTCPECGSTWSIGENIYWDRAVKNSAGGNFCCTSEECFSKHGGTITPFTKSTTPSYGTPYKPKEYLDLTFVIPAKVDNKQLDNNKAFLLQAIARADLLASELYPNLKRTSDTFGMIRSKLADQLIAVGKIA